MVRDMGPTEARNWSGLVVAILARSTILSIQGEVA